MDSCAGLAEARGCPIRIFTDQSLFAAPHDFSQRTTSFIASQCQGIHQMLLSRLMLSLSMSIRGIQPRQIGRTDTDSKKDLYVLDLPAAERSSSCVPRQSATDRMSLQSDAGLRAMQANPFIHDVNQQDASSLHKRRNCFTRSQRRKSPEYATLFGWWSQTGSNRRPEACKATALPTELWPRLNPPPEINPQGQPQSWWAWEDLNFRPHAYQARALTN